MERSGDGSFEWITFEFSRANQEVQEVPERFRVFRRVGESKEQGGSTIPWSKSEVAMCGLEGERAAAQEKKEEREK